MGKENYGLAANFGMEKLLNIVKINLFRVGRIWEPAVISQLYIWHPPSRQLQLLRCTHPRRSVKQLPGSTARYVNIYPACSCELQVSS